MTKLTYSLHTEGAFKGNMLRLDNTMFHSLYTNAMTYLAIGIASRQFMELCKETLYKKVSRILAPKIGDEVKAKMSNLEVVHMIRDKDKKKILNMISACLAII